MLKIKLRYLLTGFIIASLLFSTIQVFAAGVQKTIKVLYNSIKVYSDGNLVDVRDSAGKKAEPFLYNGSVYVPVDAVGKVSEKQVKWDSKTSTVKIESAKANQYMSDILKPNFSDFSDYKCNNLMKLSGKEYYRGYQLYPNYFRDNELSFKLDAKYSEISGIIGLDDSKNKCNADIQIFGDGSTLAHFIINGGSAPLNFSLNVKEVSKLSIIYKRPGAGNEGILDLCNLAIK